MKKTLKKTLAVFLAFVIVMISISNLMTQHFFEKVSALDNRVESAIQWAISIANDDSHGYSQSSRNGPNYDCSSFVSTAFKNGGFSVSGSLTTSTMADKFVAVGFTKYKKSDVTIQRGDILLKPGSHVELYLGDNTCVAAHNDYDGVSGDGNRKEIQVRSKNYCTFCKQANYTYVLRYGGSTSSYTYSFNFNANGGTLGSTGAFSVSYGEQFEVLNTTCTREGYNWAGWNVKRNNDNKWYVDGQGWCTESQISSNGYIKKVYPNYKTLTLDNSWTNGISGNGSYTFYAIWTQGRRTILNVFLSPYGQGENHITAWNGRTNTGVAQDRIYVWYILYDEYTGDLMNTYWDKTYSVDIAIYKPNGELYYNYTYTDSNDANWISVVPQMSGTYTATATISGFFSGSISTTYEVSYDAELLTSKSSFSLNLNGTNSVTSTITTAGGYPGSCGVGYSIADSTIASASWGGWDGDSNPITVTGKKVGTTSITIYLYEDYSGSKNRVATITLPISVTANTYTISYNANGGSGAPSSQTKYYGTDITLSSTKPTRSGHTFLGWSTSSSATSATYQPGSSFSSNSNTTLYAVWKANTYTITYNANGGSNAPSSQTKTYGTTLTLSSNKPTRTGYTFLGWSTSSSATSATYQAGGSFTSNANTTLYAVWKANTYTISYNANGGSNAPSSQTKTYGTTLTLSSNKPTRTGYTFLGWSTSSSATSATYQAGGSFTANANTTLYAVWEANTYTITYNANGGSNAPSSQTKTYGTTLTLSSNKPTRTGYTFLGWSTSSSTTSATYQAGGSFTSNANTTLYAVWKANTYTISYNANGGSNAPSSQTKTHGTTLTLSSSIPTRSGYTFLGWSTSSSATSATYQAGGSFTANANTTLYAVWEENTYTITYNANGGSNAPSSQTKTHGTTLTLSSSIPTRSGYTFLGWSTSSSATSATYQAGGSFTSNANTTLYAVWEKNALSILPGDVTGDGFIDSTDYLRVKGHFLETYILEGYSFKAGDVTGDGRIDSTDYLRIKGHFIGKYNLNS